MILQGGKERHKYGFISMYEEIRYSYNSFLHLVKDSKICYHMLFSITFSTLFNIP